MSLSWKDKIWFWMLGGKWPEEKGYTVIEGFVSGTELRCESFEGGEIWIGINDIPGLTSRIVNGRIGLSLKNFEPFKMNGKTWSVSPIQKKSYHGWLKTSPASRWYWNMQKLQDYYVEHQYGLPVTIWKPGTEKGFCYRSTPCWRVDFPGTLLDGKLKNFIPSGGHVSFKNYD